MEDPESKHELPQPAPIPKPKAYPPKFDPVAAMSTAADGDWLELGSQPIVLKNVICVYCGLPFNDERPHTKEHVVGRRFVPVGTLHSEFNVIARACSPCNSHKSKLEDDLSVISMCPTVDGVFAGDPDILRKEVVRRAAKSGNARTGRSVATPEPPIEIKSSFGAMSMTVTMVGPPQMHEERAFELARMQLAGFYFLLTYNKAEERGGFVQGDFGWITAVRKPDWGNPLMVWFAQETAELPIRLQINTAQGYYRAWMRSLDTTQDTFAWAMEWNQNVRLIGLLGMPEKINQFAASMPELKFQEVARSGSVVRRVRLSTALAEQDDTLFAMFKSVPGANTTPQTL
jgi:hypothetical protein